MRFVLLAPNRRERNLPVIVILSGHFGRTNGDHWQQALREHELSPILVTA